MISNVETFAANETERNIYFAIDMCGGFIWRMNHDMAHGRIDDRHHLEIDKDIVQARSDQMVLVRALSRFGVEPLDSEDRPTVQYWRWFRWWDSWKRGMTDDEWRKVDAAMTRGLTPEEDRQYRPSGDWRDPPNPSGDR